MSAEQSPERAELLRQYRAERIDEAVAVAYTGYDYSKRPGFPTRERVDRWNREWLELVNRERPRVSGIQEAELTHRPPEASPYDAPLYGADGRVIADDEWRQANSGTTKLYQSQKPWYLEPYYSRHVAAMTAEGLHDKAAIAEQLAARDLLIADGKRRVATLERDLRQAMLELERLKGLTYSGMIEGDPVAFARQETIDQVQIMTRAYVRCEGERDEARAALAALTPKGNP